MSKLPPLHFKCRHPAEYVYRRPEDGKTRRIARAEVPDGRVSWDVDFESYDPTSFTAPHLKSAPWADPDLGKDGFQPKWNRLDGRINRKSHEGEYEVRNGLPLNVGGRTGLAGRGILGRFGPNHTADPVVTRWKQDGKKILQFVAIQRRDTGEWAIPGGMVDPGETVSATVLREFMEEALDSTGSGKEEAAEMEKLVRDFFGSGVLLYAGYVDDPRNTDNAWMETSAFLFHDDTGERVGRWNLKAGDDAKDLKWIDVSKDVELYASHKEFVEEAARRLGAHW